MKRSTSLSRAAAALALLTASLPAEAHAVPPPDVIFSVGSQLPQVGYMLIVLLSTAAASVAGFLRVLCPNLISNLFAGLAGRRRTACRRNEGHTDTNELQ